MKTMVRNKIRDSWLGSAYVGNILLASSRLVRVRSLFIIVRYCSRLFGKKLLQSLVYPQDGRGARGPGRGPRAGPGQPGWTAEHAHRETRASPRPSGDSNESKRKPGQQVFHETRPFAFPTCGGKQAQPMPPWSDGRTACLGFGVTKHETRDTKHGLSAFPPLPFLALAWSLLLAQAAWGAAFLTGTVSRQDGSDAIPLPGAYVQVKAGSPERVVAQAATDSRGRYLLKDVPEGRVTLGVVAAGYYTNKAGGLDSETITRTCPPEGECGSVDFVAARAGVLEGYLSDDFGGPVEGVEVTLTPAPGAPPERRGRQAAGRALSDDRGYFRIWDLKPGRYLLEARMRFRFPGWLPKFQLEAREVEITGGGEPRSVSFQLRGDAGVFSISGIVERLTDEELGPTYVGIRPKVTGDDDPWNIIMGAPGGKFRMDGLEKGDYVLQTGRWGPDGVRDVRLLAVLTVDRDLTDLRLRPAPPTGVRGRVAFADGEKSNLSIRIYPKRTEPGAWEQLRIAGPDYTFEHGGLPPGEYSASLRPGDRYLVEDYAFTVRPGSMTDLEMVVSSEFAKVLGTVHLAAAAAGHLGPRVRISSSACAAAAVRFPPRRTRTVCLRSTR